MNSMKALLVRIGAFAAFLAPLAAPCRGQDAPPVFAGEGVPQVPLSRWVTNDAGLCLEVDGATAQAARFMASDLGRRLDAFPPVAEWRARHGAGFAGFVAEASQQLDLSSGDLAEALFGGNALLALWPPASGEDESRVLVLVRADRPALLARALAGLCGAQERSGVLLDVEERSHAGHAYQVRTLRTTKGERRLWLAVVENVAILAGDDATARRVLDRCAAEAPAEGSLAASTTYESMRAQLDPAAGVRLYVNPRAWDAPAVPDFAEEWPLGTSLSDVWKAARGFAASMTLGETVAVHTRVEFEPETLPSATRSLLAGMSGTIAPFDGVPADCLAAFAGRIEPAAFAQRVLQGSQGARDDSAQTAWLLGWDFLGHAVGGLGPDFTMWMDRSPAGAAGLPGWMLGVRTAGRSPPSTADRDQALAAALEAAIAIRQGPADNGTRLASSESEGLRLHTITDAGGDGITVAFSSDEGRLLAGQSSDGVARAARLEPGQSLGASPRFRELAGRTVAASGFIAYLDCAGLRDIVDRHADTLEADMVRKKKVTPDVARRSIHQLRALLDLADSLVAAARVDESGVSMSLALSAGLVRP
jgi:hypothetical protein